MLPNGAPRRLDTYIDIPLDIGLPHFISDEKMKEEGPLFGNFKLVLQSVVCHRGVSVDSGHYISLVRDNLREPASTSNSDSEEDPGNWLRFDDLANQRVTGVDIKKALREESPYLLFYQVQPINEELALRGDPPPYAESRTALSSFDLSRETLDTTPSVSATDIEAGADSEKVTSTEQLMSGHSQEATGRTSMSSNHRNSIALDDVDGNAQSISRGRTQPSTPEEQRAGFLSTSRRGSRAWLPGNNNRSRPTSQSGENRLSSTLSRLTGRGSKDKLPITEGIPPEDAVIIINEVESADSSQQPQPVVKEQKDTGLGRSKSKRDKKDRFRNKSKDASETLGKATHKEKRPDRECTVM